MINYKTKAHLTMMKLTAVIFFLFSYESQLLSSPLDISSPGVVLTYEVPAKGKLLVSLPIWTYQKSLNRVMSDLRGEATSETADYISFWSTSLSEYIRVYKYLSPDENDPSKDNKFFYNFEDFMPVEVSINPVIGFFIHNQHDDDLTLYFTGELVTNSELTLDIFKG